MQFIRLPKAIDITERVLAELVVGLVDTKSVKSIKIIVLQQLRVNLMVSWVIEWSKSWMPHRRPIRDFAHHAWAIWELCNHDVFWIIPNPVSLQRVILSRESIWTIPFQTRASDVKIRKLRQHSSNRGMPCFVNVFGTFRVTGDQPEKNPGALFRCAADILLNINNCEIRWPGMLIDWEIGQVSLVGCTYDWHNHHSGRKLILCIPLPIARIEFAVDSTALIVSEVHRCIIQVHLKWEMLQNKLGTFENIPVV